MPPPPKQDSQQTEQDRVKKQLMVLGGLLVLVALANRKTIMKKLGMDGTASAATPVKGRPAVPGAVGGPGIPPPAARKAAALTPQMIPVLDDITRKKIQDVKAPKVENITEDVIRYETRNPFVALGLDDQAIQKVLDEPVLKPTAPNKGAAQSASALGTMYFNGVIPLNGETYAVVNLPGRRLPIFVREGDVLQGTPWKLLKIGPNNAFVTLFNGSASKAKDKVQTIPRVGVSREEIQRSTEVTLVALAGDLPKDRKNREGLDVLAPHMLRLAEERMQEAQGGPGFLNPAPRAPGVEAPKPAPDAAPAATTPAPSAPPAGGDDFQFFDE